MARVSRNAAICLSQKQQDLFLPLLLVTTTTTTTTTTTNQENDDDNNNNTDDDDNNKVHSICLILWRTLLSYGLAISTEILQTMISHYSCSNHTTLSSSSSVATISCFSKICQLVKIITSSSNNNKDQQGMMIQLTNEERTCLAMSGMWLSSTVLQCVDHLHNHPSSSSSSSSNDNDNFQTMAAQLQFVYNYVTASTCMDLFSLSSSSTIIATTTTTTTTTTAAVPVVPKEKCLSLLQTLSSSSDKNSILFRALQHYVLPTAMKANLSSDTTTTTTTTTFLENEASACAFVQAYFQFLLLFCNDKKENNDNDGIIKDVCVRVQSMLLKIMVLQQQEATTTTTQWDQEDIHNMEDNSSSWDDCFRLRWLNPVHFTICEFLANENNWKKKKEEDEKVEEETKEQILSFFQCVAFALMGKLQRGEEAMAFLLLQQTCFFPKHISHMLQIEILSSSKEQLNHSMKLVLSGNTSSLTTNYFLGPFGLESLRCQVDMIPNPKKSQEEEDNHLSSFLLPLGPQWLWQILSSTIQYTTNAQLIQNATNVVLSCLDLLHTMEQQQSYYTNQFANGTKLYHLLNACMYPEHVLRHDLFPQLFQSLFTIYYHNDNHDIANQFIYASYHHSMTRRQQQQQSSTHEDEKTSTTVNDESVPQNNSQDDEYTNKDHEKLMSLFVRNESSIATISNNKQRTYGVLEMKAMNDFISDFCTIFLEYGAQYESFIYSIRMFLHPSFPNEIRVNLLTKLSGVEHLLTATDETNDSIKASLLVLFPETNHRRDSPDFLDLLATQLKKQQNSSTREKGGFFHLFCIGTLARNIILLKMMKDDSTITEHGMKQRLKGISWEIIQHVLVVTCLWNNSKSGWMDTLLELCNKDCPPNMKSFGFEDESWSDSNHVSMMSDKEWSVFMEKMKYIPLNKK